MAALARLQSSSCSNPVLDLFTSVNGVLTNVFVLEYQVFDRSTGTPVQVYPVTVGQRAAVNIATDCPAGDRLGTGHYVARWDVPSNENLGTHFVKWFFKLSSGSPEQTYTEEFEVLAEVVGFSDPALSYCLVQDLRDEGLTDTVKFTDAWVQRRIYLASRMIDAATKRHFYPKAMTLKVDGRGGPMVLLNDPIIAVSAVEFDTTPYLPSATPVDMDLIRVYNRHLTQNLESPDDRANPKIELFHPADSLTHYDSGSLLWTRLVFPRGQQNVTITGFFGFTEYDGSAKGRTPELIKHACKLLVFREIDKMARTGARFDRQNRSRITSERTRDQAYTLGPSALTAGLLTGDPEIDSILAMFVRPPGLGAA